MPLPPLRFTPLLKPRAWGGYRLADYGKDVAPAPAPAIGESWEIADLAPPVVDGVSKVATGPFQGATLSGLMESHRSALLGQARDCRGRFPLLVKYLDASENLSVQVHPTAAYAERHPGAHVKDEAWFIVRAEPGAAIYRGIKPGVTAAAFRASIARGTAVDCLERMPVRAGDYVPLQSGTCHALGAGVLVAEVQTPSDTTFRVFDWDRNEPGRPLHVDEAMECTLFGADQRLDEQRPATLGASTLDWSDGLRAATLGANRNFSVSAVEASPSGDAAPLELDAAGAPEVLMLTAGEATLVAAGHRPERLRAGDSVLLAAEVTRTTLHLDPGAVALRAAVMVDALRQDSSARPWRAA